MEYPLNNPKTIILTYEVTKIMIDNIRIVPFKNCSMTVQLLTDYNIIAKCEYLVMDGEDYANWDSSDQYLINWVLKKI